MRLALTALVMAVALPVAAAPIRSDAGADARSRVRLELKEVPLREALKRLFEGSRLRFGVDSTIPDLPISASIQDVPRESALRTLLRAAETQLPGITYEVTADVFQVVRKVVKPAPPRFEEPGARKTVVQQFDNLNLREALRKLTVGTLVRIRVHETVPDVPVSLNARQGLPLPQAARAVVADAAILVPGLTIRPQSEGYFVFIDDDRPGLAGIPGMIKLGENDYVAKIRLRYQDISPRGELLPLLLRMLALRQQERMLRERVGAENAARRFNPGPPPSNAPPSNNQ